MTTFTLRDLCDLMLATHPTLDSLNRVVYKNTDCGAHISVREPHTENTFTWHHNGADISPDTVIDAVSVGSICEGGDEGCDAEFDGDILYTEDGGLTAADIWAQMRGIDDQVTEHYAEYHDEPDEDETEQQIEG